MQFDLLTITTEEAWVLHDYVRQHDKLGQEWDKDFERRLYQSLILCIESPTHVSSLPIYDEELWQISRQVPSALMSGTQPVGRQLLVKVMRLLLKTKEDGDGDDEDGIGGNSSQNSSSGSDSGPYSQVTP